jgi:hypothetical protein
MNISKKILILCLLLAAFAGCEKNPVKPATEKASDDAKVSTSDSLTVSDSDSLSTVILTIEDKRTNPLTEITQSISIMGNNSDNQDAYYVLDIENNIAVVDSVPPGNYSLRYYSREVDITGKNYRLSFKEQIELVGQQTVEIKFIIPAHILLKFRITSFNFPLSPITSPVKGAAISTEPETVTLMTDEEGYVDFGMVPIQNYSFLINKYDYHFRVDSESGLYIMLNQDSAEINDIQLDPQTSIIKITSPENIHYQNINEIHLVGDGYDFEDGSLPDSSFTWFSDIDGELGKGRELFIPRLNVGNHTIALVGTDSQLMEGSDSVQLNLSFFDDETYFPLPYSGYWNYRYDTGDFFVDDGILKEQWNLSDLKVSADDAATRNCLMEYTISRSDSTKFCRYEVVDHYETDSENIYITKTKEQLQIFENENTSGEPTEQLDIETVYSPRYLLIKQYLNPEIEFSYETSGAVEVTWDYHHTNGSTQTLTETIDIVTSYEFGESESIKTGIGTYEAVSLIIRSEDTERTLWLAKGIGIIRMAYDSFDFPLTATLSDTNVPSFSGVGPSVVMKSPFPGNNNNRIAFNSLPDTPERMVELSKILRGLCPR